MKVNNIMARIKKFKVTIQDESFFEDLIWMSYRYCIGRHTIAAAMHASNLVSIVDNLSEDKKQFMAKDIRREINSTVNWKNNVTIEGYNDLYDAYSLVLEYLMNHTDIKDDTEYHWYINIDTGNVDVEKQDKEKGKYYESFLNDFCDISPWCKLASYLDTRNYKTITVNYENTEKTYEGFSFMYVFQNDIKKLYTTTENYKSSPYTNIHVADEFIIKIK